VQDPPKFAQIWIFGLKTNRLATLLQVIVYENDFAKPSFFPATLFMADLYRKPFHSEPYLRSALILGLSLKTKKNILSQTRSVTFRLLNEKYCCLDASTDIGLKLQSLKG
jgi:hypothetical protein